jgi:hypothetical protein
VNLIERVKSILLSPKEEWPRIAAETATVQSLYVGYIMILAAIGPIAMLVAFSALGLGFGLGTGVFAYIHSLIGVAILALIVDVLAPSFGGTKDYIAAMKLVAYSFTAVWIAQIALLIPVVGMLVVLVGLIYGFYLFFLGAPVLKKSTPDKAVPLTIVVVVSAIVLMYLFGMIARSLGFGFGMGGGSMGMGPMGMLH